jgi:hypothetical protein
MSPIEIVLLILALAAVVLALFAFVRANAALQTRAALETWIREQQQTDIQVLFLKKSGGQYNFTFANRGASSARNISLKLLDDMPPEVSPLRNAAAQLPVRQIDPGSFFQIPVQLAAETPTNFRVQVSWVNAGGLESVKEVPLNLID